MYTYTHIDILHITFTKIQLITKTQLRTRIITCLEKRQLLLRDVKLMSRFKVTGLGYTDQQ